MATQTITQTQANELYLAQARNSLSSKDCMSIYDKWAATYDEEVGDEAQNYVAPVLVAKAALDSHVNKAQSTNKPLILDAGCGTGLVGKAIHVIGGAQAIDGVDLSQPMLDVARKTGVYRHLAQADLTRPIDSPEATYDIVTCVGTFTLGHVGPDPALREFIRVVKPGNGLIISTILEEIWSDDKKYGFQTEVAKLQNEGLVRVVSDDLIDYVQGHGDKAVLLILEKSERRE